jgi:hypothetical protein
LYGSAQGSVSDSGEHGSERSGFIKGRKFLLVERLLVSREGLYVEVVNIKKPLPYSGSSIYLYCFASTCAKSNEMLKSHAHFRVFEIFETTNFETNYIVII